MKGMAGFREYAPTLVTLQGKWPPYDFLFVRLWMIGDRYQARPRTWAGTFQGGNRGESGRVV